MKTVAVIGLLAAQAQRLEERLGPLVREQKLKLVCPVKDRPVRVQADAYVVVRFASHRTWTQARENGARTVFVPSGGLSRVEAVIRELIEDGQGGR